MFLTRNWLVMNGILHGMTIDESKIFFLCVSNPRWPISSSRISLSAALGHRLLDELADLVRVETEAVPDDHVLWLALVIGLAVEDEGQRPTGIWRT